MVLTIELQVGGRLQKLTIASAHNVPDALRILGFDPSTNGVQEKTEGDIILRAIPQTFGPKGSAELNEEGLRMLEEMRAASEAADIDRGLNGSSLGSGEQRSRRVAAAGVVHRRGSLSSDAS